MSMLVRSVPQQRSSLARRASCFRMISRGMAADAKTLRNRMKVVNTIQKITKAMKVVSAAKLNGLQRNLNTVRDFAAPLTAVWKTEAPGPFASRAVVLVTSDRGLCGSLNSGLNRKTKLMLLEANTQKKSSPPYQIIALGTKGKSTLERHYGKYFLWALGDYGKMKTLSFRQTTLVADKILKENIDEMTFLYNRFKNMMSIEQKQEVIVSPKLALASAGPLKSKYTIESGGYSDVIRDLYEFRFAVRVWHMFSENMTSEMSSRMNAMQNSSKAATEMLQALTLQYNRTRQAKITTELIEIVSGAAALDNAKD
jgi:F-type H+-transporting ATPase subunit gamma